MRPESWRRRIGVSVGIVAAGIAAMQGCSGPRSSSPTAPSRAPTAAVAAAPSPSLAFPVPEPVFEGRFVTVGSAAFVAGTRIPRRVVDRLVSGPMDVVFPPRSEPLLFRTALEGKYRDGLRRPLVQTYVDQEGTVVWVQEYLRYRVNLCAHAEAITRVFRQIDGQGIQPTCGTTSTASFPARQEPLDFMVQLEAKYRDGLRRPPGSSYVDVEGNVIWTQEYLRYRVSACSHSQAQTRVFDQIDGRGVQADCQPPPLTFTFIAAACACVNGSIEIRMNNTIMGLLGCSETRSFTVPAGTYTISACGSNGCFGGSTLGTFSSSATRRLVC